MKFLVKRASAITEEGHSTQPFPGTTFNFRVTTDSRPWGPIFELGKSLTPQERIRIQDLWVKFQQEGFASNYRQTPKVIRKKPETVQIYYERDVTIMEWFWECKSLDELLRLQHLVQDNLIICTDTGRPCIIIHDDYL